MIVTSIFIRIVVAVTGVQLLIEGSSCSRVAFINLRVMYVPPHCSWCHPQTSNLKDWFLRTALWTKDKQLEPSQGRLLPCFCLNLTIIHHPQSRPHPLNCVCARHAATSRGWLLFLSQSFRCSYYSREATIRGAVSIGINMVFALCILYYVRRENHGDHYNQEPCVVCRLSFLKRYSAFSYPCRNGSHSM